MDDPIFDPWGEESTDPGKPAPRPAAPKWRSRATSERVAPSVRPASPQPEAAPPGKQPRLTAADVIRSVAAKRLELVAHRLRLARHIASVRDLLDGQPPALRLEVRLRTEPLGPPSELAAGALELAVAGGSEDEVVVRGSLGASSTPTEEARIPARALHSAWVDGVALSFVQRLLGRV